MRKNIPQDAVNKKDLSVGYNYFIKTNGEIQIGRDESEVCAAVEGHNSRSINICLSGKNFFYNVQFESCRKLITDICARHGIELYNVVPHKALNKAKTCPNFDIEEKLLYNIYN